MTGRAATGWLLSLLPVRPFMERLQLATELIDPVLQPGGVVPHTAHRVAADRFVLIGNLREGLADPFTALVEFVELVAVVLQLIGE